MEREHAQAQTFLSLVWQLRAADSLLRMLSTLPYGSCRRDGQVPLWFFFSPCTFSTLIPRLKYILLSLSHLVYILKYFSPPPTLTLFFTITCVSLELFHTWRSLDEFTITRPYLEGLTQSDAVRPLVPIQKKSPLSSKSVVWENVGCNKEDQTKVVEYVN